MKDECRKLGLHTRRADEFSGSGMSIDEIPALLEKAEFIVCDLTRERPNVYSERGYAHGVGNEASDILLIAQAGTKLHFDLAPLRVQYYTSTERLRTIVFSSLEVMIRKTRRKEEIRKSPSCRGDIRSSYPARGTSFEWFAASRQAFGQSQHSSGLVFAVPGCAHNEPFARLDGRAALGQELAFAPDAGVSMVVLPQAQILSAQRSPHGGVGQASSQAAPRHIRQGS